MSDGPLLVPAHLYAMVLSAYDAKATAFFAYEPDYDALQRFEPVDPVPFATATGEPDPGVYLHWLIPRPLRHAPDVTQGAAGFHLVPNRWLVARVGTGDSADVPLAAWVVVTDQLGADGGAAYLDASAGGSAIPTPTRTGRCMTLSDYLAAPPSTGTPFLQAVRPGDATFTVFAPAARNVFGFHDPMAGLDKGTFAYHVVGWYTDEDPIADVSWRADSASGDWVDERFGFQAFATEAPTPVSMLVHALLPGLSWDPDAEHALSIPSDVQDTVTLAAGNTAVDALSAIVSAEHGPAEGQMLQAFQYGALDAYDQPASATVLDRTVRRHWFGSVPGGTVWRVVPPAPLSPEQAKALDALNAAQEELDRQTRVLAAMRTALAGLWWKLQWLLADPIRRPPGMDRTWMLDQLSVHLGETAPAASPTHPYIAEVERQQDTVASAQQTVATAQQALDAQLSEWQERKAGNRPQYHSASDPVVLLRGLSRSFVLDPTEALTCRFVSQLVIDEHVTIPPLDKRQSLLPDGVVALHREAVTLAVDGPPHPAPAPSADGVFPPPPEAMQPWQQPWFPLLLDWRVTLLAAPACEPQGGAGGVRAYAFDQSQWSFDGTDWSWAGSNSPQAFDYTASGNVQLSGRTFITPQLPNTLAAQIAQYTTQHGTRDPDLAALLEELADDLGAKLAAVGEQDFLSQRLSGLRSLLAQRDPATTASPPVGSRVAAALGDHRHAGTPSPRNRYSTSPVLDFAPVAGTFFTIDGLRVVDSMGQAIDATYANHNPQPVVEGTLPELGLFPLAAPGLRTPLQQDPPPATPLTDSTAGRMLVLPPRLAQPAQVRLSLLSADGADTELTLAAAADPLCGWLVPNHLDRSVSVYDAGGTALGELATTAAGATGAAATWFRDPTDPNAPQSPAEIANPYLAQMLGSLYARADAPDALSDLLLTIDESLWTVEAGAPRVDEDLAVLVGRPLAVVRAELSLRLDGIALTRQDWWATFDVPHDQPPQPGTAPVALGGDDGGLGTLTWPVRLGDQGLRDDGLIGLFLDVPGDPVATWGTFRAVNRPGDATSGYVKQSGTEVEHPRLRFVDDLTERDPTKTDEVIRMTLVLDPRAAVHAFTGLLPVTTLQVPDRFTKPALRAIAYLFRAGPILTPPDELRIPRPHERRGQWSWFDRALGTTVPVAPSDQNATLPATPPRAVEGWLKLTGEES